VSQEAARKQRRRAEGLGKTKVSGLDPKRWAPSDMKLEILERDGYCCRYCGVTVTFRKANIDHVVPWHRHGATTPSNLVTSCAKCNVAKGGGQHVRPRHLGKKPGDLFKTLARGHVSQPPIKRDYVTVPEYQTPCKHKKSPNCLRQRCLDERGITYTFEEAGG